jgi:hypothetical protein
MEQIRSSRFADARTLFIGPDLILHVYDRWKRGTADEQTTRMFGIRDSRKAPRFVMIGGRAVVEYVRNWSLERLLPLLRRLPSLSEIEDDFWDYLSGLRIRGTVRAIPDGTGFGSPVRPSAQLLEEEGEGAYDLSLIEVTDGASAVALISPALLAIVDAQVAYGALLWNHKLEDGPPTFWFAERQNHPVWGRLATEVEAILAPADLYERQRRVIYLAWDPANPFFATPRGPGGAWKHEHESLQPLVANGFPPRVLAQQFGVEVRLLVSGPVNVKMKHLGETKSGA